MKPELEVCASDLDSILAAAEAGADRAEICTALPIGGITPCASLLHLSAGIARPFRRHVLIRPRPGDFLYTENEIRLMEADLATEDIKDADGFVIGMLTPDGQVDCRGIERLIAAIPDDIREKKSLTFHRAFDMTADPLQALEDIIALGFDRILTSGCAATAEAGIPMLRKLNEKAAGRIIIMAGCGVNATNAARILTETGVRSLHASCSHRVESHMRFRNSGASMGSGSDDEYGWASTDIEKVRALREIIDSTCR